MWYSSVSLVLAVATGMQILQGVFLMTISFHSEELSENVALSFGEQMDYCNDSNNQNSVRLVNMGLSSVGEDFVGSTDVQFITLENNNIYSFSVDAFKSVPNLSCLNIRKNQISKSNIPFLKHDNLRKLNLANNKISFSNDKIKEWNVSLPRLTHLDLSDNGVSSLPEETLFISSFPSLTHFYFSGNSFGNSIFRYLPPSTQHLYLERTDYVSVTNLPPRIVSLFLNGNSINDFSTETLPTLRTLSLRKCKGLTYVIPRIYAPNLVDLDLSSSGLKNLPRHVSSQMTSLQRLSLEDNDFSSFTVLNELRLLTDLSLNFNNITYITAESMGNLKNLKRLYLRGNRISLIEANAFSNCNFLEKLDLSQNKLTKLPPTWMFSFQALSHLDLRSNQFATIDSMSVNVYTKSMENLYLGKNNFTRIDMSSLEKMNKHVIIHVF